MSQSLSKLYINAIFHVKHNQNLLKSERNNQLYAYIGGVIKLSNSIPIIVNGTENHIHILCIMSKNISLADLMEQIKSNSSRWIKTLDTHYREFAWQGGYAGYSVSQSQVDVIKKYIENQKVHHQTQGFQDEYTQFLKKNEVNYTEDYLWK